MKHRDTYIFLTVDDFESAQFANRGQTIFRHHLAAIFETESPKQMPKKGQDERFFIRKEVGPSPKRNISRFVFILSLFV
jgi:hypothetical protein